MITSDAPVMDAITEQAIQRRMHCKMQERLQAFYAYCMNDPMVLGRKMGCLPIDPIIASLCDRGEIERYPGDLFDPIAQRIVQLALVASAPKMQKQAS